MDFFAGMNEDESTQLREQLQQDGQVRELVDQVLCPTEHDLTFTTLPTFNQRVIYIKALSLLCDTDGSMLISYDRRAQLVTDFVKCWISGDLEEADFDEILDMAGALADAMME